MEYILYVSQETKIVDVMETKSENYIRESWPMRNP
jgi:hypothetical protein